MVNNEVKEKEEEEKVVFLKNLMQHSNPWHNFDKQYLNILIDFIIPI